MNQQPRISQSEDPENAPMADRPPSEPARSTRKKKETSPPSADGQIEGSKYCFRDRYDKEPDHFQASIAHGLEKFIEAHILSAKSNDIGSQADVPETVNRVYRSKYNMNRLWL